VTQAQAQYRPARTLTPLVLGIFLRALQMTVIGPSLVAIAFSLRVGLADLGWVIAAYATGSLVAQPIAGRLSDAKGRRLVFAGAVAVFALGSLICALSTSLLVLIGGRIVQSLGAGAIQPAANAIVGDSVPEQRQGAALGLIYAAFGLAAVLGSVVGGELVDAGTYLGLRFPWHLIFWVNVPLAILTLVLAGGLPADTRPTQRVGFDLGAIVLIAGFAACLMAAANTDSAMALLWLAASAACVAGLVLWERRASQPLLDPSLFAQRGPALIYAIALVSGVPIFSVTMYAAAYYIAQFHSTAAESGIALLWLALPLGAGQAAGGVFVNRFGARTMLIAGIVALALGCALFAALPTMWGVRAALAVAGLGMGIASAPPNVLIYRYLPSAQRGAATGLLTMFASSGAITAPAAVTAFLRHGAATAAPFRAEYLVACAIAAVCIPLAWALPEVAEMRVAHVASERSSG
jgi:MFS family permease